LEQIRIPICEGVTLHYIYTDKFKTSILCGLFFDSLNQDRASQNAILPYILLGGSEGFKSQAELNRRLYHLYGARILPVVKKKGDIQMFGLLCEHIGNRYALEGEDMLQSCARLLCEVLFDPNVPEGGFVPPVVEVEKNNLKDAIDAKINNKRDYAYQRLNEIMCEGEPYAVDEFGSKQQCDKIDPKTLYDHYRSVISEYPIELYYVGDADREQVISILKECLARFSGKRNRLPHSSISTGLSSKVIDEKMDITQSKLAMGFKTNISSGHPEYFPLVLANAVYGAGANSKLFLNVREKLSLCYYVFSKYDKQKGCIVVSAGVDEDKLSLAKEEIMAQLDRIKNGNLTQNELETTKKTLINAYRNLYDSPWDLVDFLCGESVCGASYSVEEYIKKVSAVTVEEAVSASKLILPDAIYTLTGKGRR